MIPLFLYFPQWQGSGETNEIYHGAATLRQTLLSHFSVLTAGVDIAVPETELLQIQRHILGYDAILRQMKQAKATLAQHQPERIFSLGGDCGVEVMPVSYLNQRYQGDLGVLWLDAHGDLNTPQTSPSKHFHGMPLRHLMGEGEPSVLKLCDGVLRPEQVFLCGVRDLDHAEQQFMTEKDLIEWDIETLAGGKSPLDRFNHLYIHLDLDVLNPEAFSCVKCPTKGGMTLTDLNRLIINLLERFNVVGLSVLECVAANPSHLPPGFVETLQCWLLAFMETEKGMSCP